MNSILTGYSLEKFFFFIPQTNWENTEIAKIALQTH